MQKSMVLTTYFVSHNGDTLCPVTSSNACSNSKSGAKLFINVRIAAFDMKSFCVWAKV